MTIITVIIFLIVLAVLIFVHELGHFLLARACGIRVDSFKIGFGPKVVSWHFKGKDGKPGETEYGVNWIPFGGYVNIYGENPDEQNLDVKGSDAHRSFSLKPRWKQAIVLVAGVLFNFIFAWLLYVGVFATNITADPQDYSQYSSSFTDPRIIVTDVSDGSPAKMSGVKIGDVITAVEIPALHEDLTASNGSLTVNAIVTTLHGSNGNPVTFDYMRDGRSGSLTIIPQKGIVPGAYAIGIVPSDAITFHLPIFSAIKEGTIYFFFLVKSTLAGLWGLIVSIFHGSASLSDVSGPIAIAEDVGTVLGIGFNSLIAFVALISINLGIVNLLPFPALDGGRILFVAIEGVIRRRISPKFTNAVNTVGFVLLMLLMIAVTYKDIAKLVMK